MKKPLTEAWSKYEIARLTKEADILHVLIDAQKQLIDAQEREISLLWRENEKLCTAATRKKR